MNRQLAGNEPSRARLADGDNVAGDDRENDALPVGQRAAVPSEIDGEGLSLRDQAGPPLPRAATSSALISGSPIISRSSIN